MHAAVYHHTSVVKALIEQGKADLSILNKVNGFIKRFSHNVYFVFCLSHSLSFLAVFLS